MLKGILFPLVAVCLFFASAAKSEAKPTLVEAGITASIQNERMETNLLIENDSRAFPAKIRLEILDATDRVISENETSQTVKSGRNILTVPVSLSERRNVNDLLWYRLRYTIVSKENPMSGIVSLSEILPELFALRVSASQQIFAGMNYVARVRAYHPTKENLVPGVKINGKLNIYTNNESGKNVELRTSGVTDADGYATLDFEIPAAVRFSNSYYSGSVEFTGEKNDLKNYFSESLQSPQAGFSVYLNTDKPLYQPGQRINIRGLALLKDFAGLAQNPAAEENLEFIIKDEGNIVLYRETVKTSRFGIASIGWQIPDNAKLGSYRIEVKSDKNSYPSYHSFRISRYELPQFVVKTKADKDFYLPTENKAEITIDAAYLFGKPVEKGKVRVVRESRRNWNYSQQKWDIGEEETYEGETDESGKYIAEIDLSKTHQNLSNNEAQFEDLAFTAYFTDATTNRSEQRRFDIRATKEPVHVYLIGKVNNRRNPKLPLDFFVSTFSADGKPLVCDVEIRGRYEDEADAKLSVLKKVKTNALGAAKVKFSLPKKSDGVYTDENLELKIVARDRENHVGTEDKNFPVDADEKQIFVETDKAIYRQGEPIKIDVAASGAEETVFIDVVKNLSSVVSKQIKLKNGRGKLQIPFDSGFKNNLTVSAYFDDDGKPASDTQAIFYPSPDDLRIDINSEKEVYRPNEEAAFNFAVGSPNGNFSENALGVFILDKAVEERARTDAQFGGATDIFGGFGGLLGYAENFGGLTRKDLENLDLKKPILPELQLAAEVMFENTSYQPNIRNGYYSGNLQYVFGERTRKEFEKIQRALQFRYSNTGENPADEATLRRILYQSNIDFDNLRDPWGNPYRVEVSTNNSYSIFQIRSNGANKVSNDRTVSGEKDDYVAMQMYFEYFRQTGLEINEAVQDFYRKTGKFVRDTETLRAALLEKGMRLEDLKDRWGEPYRADFGVNGRNFTVQFLSGGADKKFAGNSYDDFHVWTSHTDYFGETEKKIQTILDRYAKDSNTFPKTDAEFKQVLKAGGMDFENLRDGWNHPFYLEIQTVSRLADRVKIEDIAERDIKEEEKLTITPVTQELAIFRLRSAGENGVKETDYRDPIFSNFAGIVNEKSKEDALPKLTVSKKEFLGGKAAIYGMILDANQAVIPNALIKITNLADQTVYETSSNGLGIYLQTKLPPGKYSVRADVAGFKSLIVNDISVTAENLSEINMKLEVGAVSEVVTVTSEIDSIVNTTDASIGNTFSAAQISQLPINGRNFSSLLTLSAGVSQNVYGAWKNKDVSYIIDGASGSENRFIIDGQEIANFRSGQLNENNRLPENQPKSTPRLREYFPETLLWSPEVITDASGNAQIKVRLADNITTWKMYAIASNLEGKIGIAEKEFKAFQPFFVDLSPPPVLTEGDEIFLPVQVRNYTETKQNVAVEMAQTDWFTFLGADRQQIEVGSNSSQNAVFAFRAERAEDDGRQKVTAIADTDSDAMEKRVVVKPNGREIVKTSGDIFTDKISFDVNFPENALANTPKAELKIYPNLFAHVGESVEGLLKRPYGCGEQTISSTYPNLMILKITGEDHRLRPLARKYLQMGYERLLGYQVSSGGFSYWGGNEEANLSLTAYALRFLNDARAFIDVDENVIRRAQNYLISQQRADGSWTTQYHGETTEDATRTKQTTTYLARTLAMNERGKKEKSPELQTSLQKSFRYLKTAKTSIEDAYALANFGLAALDAGDAETAQAVGEKLQKAARSDGGGTFWSIEGSTPFYGWGTAGQIETTALVIQFLQKFKTQNSKFKSDDGLISKATLYLLKNKDRYGVWYSTQATINVLNALTEGVSGETSGGQTERTAEIFVNNQKAGEIKLPPTNELSFPQIYKIPKNLLSSNNSVEIRLSGGKSATMAQVVQSHYISWRDFLAENAGENQKQIKLEYNCDKQSASPTEEIACEVKTARVGRNSYGMLLAEIGLPPGADVDRASLEKAKSENWNLSRYEVLPDRIIFYLWSNPNGTNFNFKFKPRYGINAQTPASVVYDYYNEEAKGIVAPLKFSVR